MTALATQAQLKAAATATFIVFGINGLVFASWAARIPAVTEILQITPGQMGALLLCVAAGSLITLPTAGYVTGRIGTANTVRVAGIIAAIAGVGIAVSLSAATTPGTAIFLFFFGIGIGLWDVAQNIEGADVEHQRGRTIMPQFHAAFSGGAFIGALIGAGMSIIGIGLPAHLLAIAAAVAVATFLIPKYFRARIPAGPQSPVEDAAPKVRSAWTDRRTLLIGIVVLGATLTEGAGNDWIAKAAVDGLEVSEPNGAFTFAVFVLAMTIMRLFGGKAIDAYGRVPVLRGIGAALAFPMGMSAAADDPKQATARVSVVSTLGYVAFLAGPPLLGFLGDVVGIRMALLVIGVPILAALLLVGAAKPLPNRDVQNGKP